MPRNRTALGALYRFFYWTGILLAMVSLSLVLGRSRALLLSWGSLGIPWSWVAGIAAILAFVIAEVCDARDRTVGEPGQVRNDPEPSRVPVHESV